MTWIEIDKLKNRFNSLRGNLINKMMDTLDIGKTDAEKLSDAIIETVSAKMEYNKAVEWSE